MRKSSRPLVIASRRSPLARAQTQAVAKLFAARDPELKIKFKWMESEGDVQTQAVLAEQGGKGLFARAIERALLRGEADLAVHSAKDLPAAATPGLTIAATPPRADVRDCLITREGLDSIAALPHGAKVGTSSPRRAAQLKRLRPDLDIQPLRGNIETRLRKVLEENVCDATLLAVAGLTRGGLAKHALHAIDTAVMLPAACQGALALQCRNDDHTTLLRCLPVNDAATAQAVHAERQVIAALEGDCHSAIAVLVEALEPPAEPGADTARRDRHSPYVRLRARVLSPDGAAMITFEEAAPLRQLGKLVGRAIASLKEQGAVDLLRPC
ncbi:MAG: hydroxymethylbilane synthase [Phycisphaeraceae bacterium]